MSTFKYDNMLMTFGYIVEEDSRNKSDNVKKSYHRKNNRVYTNKNRLVGRKLRSVSGKKLKLKAEQLDKIEEYIISQINKGKTYQTLIDYFAAKHDIKISLGYISNIKKKYMK